MFEPIKGKRWIRFGLAGMAVTAAVVALAVLGAPGVASASADSDDPEKVQKKKKDARVIVIRDGDEDEGGEVVRVELPEGEDEEDGKAAYLGVQLQEETKNAEGGARVVKVVEDSPADEAGLREGDIIVGFDGDVVRGPMRLTERIHTSKPGDEITLKVIREGRKENLTVELGKRPGRKGYWYGFDDEGGSATPLPDMKELEKSLEHQGERLKELGLLAPHARGKLYFWRGRPKLGVQLVEMTPELRRHLGGSEDAGVLVGKVLSETPAQKSGVRVGDVIIAVDGNKVEDAEDLIEALEETEGKKIELEVIRDRKTMRLEVAIPNREEEEDEPTGPRAWAIPPPTPPPAPALAPPAPPAPPRPETVPAAPTPEALREAEVVLRGHEAFLMEAEGSLRGLSEVVRRGEIEV